MSLEIRKTLMGSLQSTFMEGNYLGKEEKYRISLETIQKSLIQIPEGSLTISLREILDGGAAIRNKYKCIVALLRENQSNEDVPVIAFNRFYKTILYPHCRELVTTAMESVLPYSSVIPLFHLPFDTQFYAIDNMWGELGAKRIDVAIRNILAVTNTHFDPYSCTNVPFVWYSVPVEGMMRLCLRMGSPTIQEVFQKTHIAPEFEAALESAASNGLIHCYINLQNRAEKVVCGENTRTEAIENLSERYPRTAYIASLPQDTHFYHQTGVYSFPVMDSVVFMSEFELEMFERGNDSFFFSSNFCNTDLRKKLLECLQDVHRAVFDSNEELTLSERRVFIEIAYALFVLKLLIVSQANFFNITCKDAIDRAGKTNSILFYILGLMTGIAQTDEFKEQHMILTHAPALLVKKQAIIPSRRKRFLEAIQYLVNEKVTARFAGLASSYGLNAPPKMLSNIDQLEESYQ